MTSSNACASACKFCRYYQPEGRRGGICHQLSAPVKAAWKACALAMPAFASPWETLEEAWNLPNLPPIIAPALPTSLSQNLENLTPATCEIPVIASIG